MPKKNFFPKEPALPSIVYNHLFIDYYGKKEESEEEDFSEDSDGPNLLLPFLKNVEERNKRNEMKKKHLIEESYVGKWMMFLNNKKIDLARGMTHQDYAWQFVKPLVDDSENTYIESAHCSTGNPFPYGTDPNTDEGLICCFTRDYRNKYQVKKAAKAIRRVFYYPRDLYYKTDEATYSDVYKHFGHNFVSLYKFTIDNKLYERDEEDPRIWNLVML